jgi:hypothetical protein
LTFGRRPLIIIRFIIHIRRVLIMWWHYSLELLAVLIMVGGVGGILYGVLKGTIALSTRTVQLLTVVFVLPLILILSLERGIGNEAAAALIGTIVGYVLAGISRGE